MGNPWAHKIDYDRSIADDEREIGGQIDPPGQRDGGFPPGDPRRGEADAPRVLRDKGGGRRLAPERVAGLWR